MVLTRKGSRLQPDMNDNIPISASGPDTRPMAENTAVTAATTNPTNAVVDTATTSSPAPHVLSDVSVSSEALNNTVVSPEFASQTAQDIRRDFRRDDMGFQRASGHGSELNEMAASVGLMQAQLMRSVEEIKQLRNELSQQISSVRQSGPPVVTQQPPPSMAIPAHRARTENQFLLPPPGFRQPRESNQLPNRPVTQPPLAGSRVNPPPLSAPGAGFRPPPNYDATHERYAFQPAEAPYWQSPQSMPYPPVPSPGPRYDVKKWGVRFDGSDQIMDAEDFIFRLESMRQDYGYPYEELLRDFPQLLEGSALDWYWQQRRIAPFNHWGHLREAFLAQFRRFQNEFQIQKRIMDRRQLPNEPFEEFFNEIIKMRNQQRVPYNECDLVEIMKGNLKSSLAALIFPIRIHGLNHFRQEVKRAEAMIAGQRQAYQQRPYQPPRVHELHYEEAFVEPRNETVGVEVDALRDTTKYTCWNCRKRGHSYVECPMPIGRVFCFRCGKEGVVTPKCPKCQGNWPRSAPRTAEARSTQTEPPQQ
ncbi:uncharacterized protein LOC131994293 [Stomoxys calcitrans]|uniref:uncharacterized protein LOC131994293 n=1 Tax=Stomoxys calcitrans TaxID=35570 RepID=UPI0027E3069A|nr:uncharacterized protein LOC131994293 [Stomoxys calcitrans]